VPITLATAIICLAAGAGAGVLGMTQFGYSVTPTQLEGGGEAPKGPASPPGGAGRPMGPPGGSPGGFGGMRPQPKNQLARLVAKIDQLTQKPLHLNLNAEQQAKLRAQLQGLDEIAELSDDDARQRLDAILEIVKEDKDTLEAAGYNWPGQQGGGRGGFGQQPAPNPFKEGSNAKHLKSLQDQLAKKG
jgi:hypothetical protein